jgi:hypothetical protein
MAVRATADPTTNSRKRGPEETDPSERSSKRQKTGLCNQKEYQIISPQAVNPVLTALPASSMMAVDNFNDLGTRVVEQLMATPADAPTSGTQFMDNVPLEILPEAASYSSPFSGVIPMEWSQNQDNNQPQLTRPSTFHLYQVKNHDPISDDAAPFSFFTQTLDFGVPLYGTAIYIDDPVSLAQELDKLSIQLERSETPSTCESYCALGVSFIARRDYPMAQENFQKAIGLDPNNLAAKLGLANCHFYKGEFSEAIELCLLIPETDPSWASAQFKIGCCHVKLNNLPEAIKYFGRVPERHCYFGRAQFNIGSCYYNQKEHLKAIEHFDMGNDPAKVSHFSMRTIKFNAAQYYSGLCYIALNNLEMALKQLNLIPATSRYYSAAKTKLLNSSGSSRVD